MAARTMMVMDEASRKALQTSLAESLAESMAAKTMAEALLTGLTPRAPNRLVEAFVDSMVARAALERTKTSLAGLMDEASRISPPERAREESRIDTYIGDTDLASTLSAIPSAHRAGSQDRETVINRAIAVIGDEQEAFRWLGTPVRALDYATPISRLNDPEGQTAVLNVLTQLEHGIL
jgi:Protein of unknown function (DUF2384)